MTACELCLLYDQNFLCHKVTPVDVSKMSRNTMTIKNEMSICGRCRSDVQEFSAALLKWQNRILVRSTPDFVKPANGKGNKPPSLSLKPNEKSNVVAENSAEMAMPFKCDVCTKRFQEQVELKSHVFRHHKCFNCSANFLQKADLQNHVKMCLQNKQFKCSMCFLRFETEDDVARHLESAHGDKTIYKCDQCHAAFPSAAALHGHSKFHRLISQVSGSTTTSPKTLDDVPASTRGNNHSTTVTFNHRQNNPAAPSSQRQVEVGLRTYSKSDGDQEETRNHRTKRFKADQRQMDSPQTNTCRETTKVLQPVMTQESLSQVHHISATAGVLSNETQLSYPPEPPQYATLHPVHVMHSQKHQFFPFAQPASHNHSSLSCASSSIPPPSF